ncbi:MAG: homocysteine S-methyltransferase family protein [Rhodobacteraceae bacterium]|nr:homocysteine S-methyltransferase family protein [Paracoccaceae bacterium]
MSDPVASDHRFGAYANAFSSVDEFQLHDTNDVFQLRDDLGPTAYADAAISWIAAGASIVGGCCEIGPAHIRVLASQLGEKGHKAVCAIAKD